jgi:hypothetical protein
MNEALATTMVYPTLPLSILLAFLLVYWLISATGMFGEHHHHHGGDLLDVVGTGGDGHLHHHASHGHNAPGGDHHGDMTDAVGVSGWLQRLGFSAVPLVTGLTLVVMSMWAITYAVHVNFLMDVSPVTRVVVGTVVMALSLLPALLAAAMLLVPVRWAMKHLSASSSEDRQVLGHEALVVSSVLDDTQGRVRVSSSSVGVSMELSARAAPGESFKLHDKVVVVSHDKISGICQVVSLESFSSAGV